MALDHEKLDVYRAAIEFIAWGGDRLADSPEVRRLPAAKHLDEASQSTANDIAEGNGKRSPADRCRFLDIARGSALECAACLDALVARKRVMPQPGPPSPSTSASTSTSTSTRGSEVSPALPPPPPRSLTRLPQPSRICTSRAGTTPHQPKRSISRGFPGHDGPDFQVRVAGTRSDAVAARRSRGSGRATPASGP